ncbi:MULTISPECIES: condensation domain-containing protein [Streptomyces]|uniref:Condensation domain-containing protein n=1 Tax=Streptomyces caniscabiei TaxID=2746961 RepID=A0ABU4N248_9ACTN|nr:MULTISPECIES: condensation domain-containing protein [Streptomyces]MBE4741676.1 hypothetical protein [Streptomyces caniscabiei]MBE4762030.1 hypothetical protein [Streptomyces caniscabiei]MBE4775323.1 hypothetical protein [Streptomyces caniscabiei]MBE4790494.1 hypothetical protein [Streptomyces caniscabiei]MBE4799643.1 hypothetical protein [Streptomyces caniscabiei]
MNTDEVFPLTWGQQGAWWAQQRTDPPSWLLLSEVISVPEGTSAADVARALEVMLARHEVLRTTFRIGADGEPEQIVHRRTDLAVLAAADESEAWERLASAAFDLEREFPIRAALTVSSGKPSKLCILLHHVAVDELGKVAFSRHLRTILENIVCRAGAGDELAGAAPSPRDHARTETSESGRKMNEDALSHWRQAHHRRIHDRPPREPGHRSGKRCSLTMRSPSLLSLSREIARREKCLPATVLIAALAVCLANRNGRDSALLSMLMANRNSPDRLDAVCSVVQQGWLRIECGPDSSFRDVIRETNTALRQCLRHGRYDVGEFYAWKLGAGANDAVYDPPLVNFINGAQGHDGDCGGDDVVDVEVWDTSEASMGANDIKIIVYPCHTTVNITADDAFLTASEGDALMRGLPALLRQVRDEAGVLRSQLEGLGPAWVPPSEDWVDIDGCWARLRDLRAVLERCPGVRHARVFHEDRRGQGKELLACVVAEPEVTPASVRYALRVLRADADWFPLPHWFAIHGVLPAQPSSVSGWLTARATAEGAGDEAYRQVPEDAAERALGDVFMELHPDVTCDLAKSYAESGGRYLRMPALVERISRAGLQGLRIEDLMTATPMARLARKLERR